MIYKGRVIEIRKDYAIVVTDRMTYYKVVMKHDLITGQQILFVKEDIYQEKKRKITRISQYAAVLLVLLLSVTLVTVFETIHPMDHTAIAIMSIDINPSIEFEINKEKKVIKLLPINEEGYKVADKSFIGKDIREAIYMIITNAQKSNYITDYKDSVLIGIAVLEKDYTINLQSFEKELKDKMNCEKDLNAISIFLLQVEKEEIDTARQHEISIGKYGMYKKIKNLDPEIGLEDVKFMKTQELIECGMGQRTMRKRYQPPYRENNNSNQEMNMEAEKKEIRRYQQGQTHESNNSSTTDKQGDNIPQANRKKREGLSNQVKEEWPVENGNANHFNQDQKTPFDTQNGASSEKKDEEQQEIEMKENRDAMIDIQNDGNQKETTKNEKKTQQRRGKGKKNN